MRRIIVIASVAAACAVTAPLALAGGVRRALDGWACRPFALAGRVASVAGDSFVLDARKAHGRALAGSSLTVSVGAATRFLIGNRPGALGDLVDGQPVLVAGRACQSGTPGQPALTARLVLTRASVRPVDPTTAPPTDDGLGAASSSPAPAAGSTTLTSGGDETSIE